MSHSIQRLPASGARELARRPSHQRTHWYERAALIIVIILAYVWLQAEIGDWQALIAITGAPLAVFDDTLRGRFAMPRRRSRDPHIRPAVHHKARHAPVLWISPAPSGLGIIVSGRPSIPVEVTPQVDRTYAGLPAPLPLPSPDPKNTVPTPPIGRSQHCVLFAVDIAHSTADGRDDEVQLAIREALYRLLTESFRASGIPWASCIHEDRGDGVVVVIPAHMPTITVVDPLIEQIRVRLRRHNRLSSHVAQVRLRLAVHIGEVYRDRHGLAGKAVNHLFRMLDADELRHALQLSESGLALIVSDYVYESVIDGGPSGVDPAAYSEVTVKVKQFKARAWLLEVPTAA